MGISPSQNADGGKYTIHGSYGNSYSSKYTHLKTNEDPLNIDGWKMKYPFNNGPFSGDMLIFSGYIYSQWIPKLTFPKDHQGTTNPWVKLFRNATSHGRANNNTSKFLELYAPICIYIDILKEKYV